MDSMEEGKKSMNEDWNFNYNEERGAIIRTLAEGIKSHVFLGINSMISVVHIDPYTKGTIHSHPEEQWGILVSGTCKRIQNGKEMTMTKGDFWYTPSNILHGISTDKDPAVIIDFFSPSRDAYTKSGKGYGEKNA